jgi:hypothetical protein
VTVARTANRSAQPGGLAEVLEIVLDKGIVIEAFARVTVVGIELLTVEARVVVASVDTYLRFAEAMQQLEGQKQQQSPGLPGLIGSIAGGGQGDQSGQADGQGADQVAGQESLSGEDQRAIEAPGQRPDEITALLTGQGEQTEQAELTARGGQADQADQADETDETDQSDPGDRRGRGTASLREAPADRGAPAGRRGGRPEGGSGGGEGAEP